MAIEPNEWTSYLRQNWPNWLEDIEYPAPGVGDLEDLKLSLGVGQDGRWLGFVNPGWYYHNNSEQYNYVKVGSIVAVAASSSGSLTEAISFRPTWGPVLTHGRDMSPLSGDEASYRSRSLATTRGITHWWSPRSCSVDASGLAAPTTSGQIIMRAADLVGSSHATIPSSATALFYNPRELNGYPAWVSGDGTNRRLIATSALSSAYASGFSVYVVIAINTNADTIVPVGADDWYLVRTDTIMGGNTGDLTDSQTNLPEIISRFGVLWMTYNGSARTVGFNGHYVTESVTGTFNPETSLYIGALDSGSFGYNDPFGDVITCSVSHTLAEVKDTVAKLMARYGKHSVLVGDGNSLLTGLGSEPLTKHGTSLGARIPGQLPEFIFQHYGISGQTTPTMVTNASSTVHKCPLAFVDKNVCFLWEGTNHIEAGVPAASAYASLVQYSTAARAAGYKVVVGTVLDRAWGSSAAAKDAIRLTTNAMILSGAPADFDAVVDIASIPGLTDSTNTTYFMTDAIHLTASGVGLVLSYLEDAIEELYTPAPYREHHNSFFPAATLTWTAVSSAASTVLVSTLPASSVLMGLRNSTNLPLGSVAGTGLLSNSKLYYYDLTNNQVYIKPVTPSDLTPDLWADLLYTYPKLRFREIVVSEKDASGNSYVRPSYNQIEDVKLIREGITTAVTGYLASGTITHSLSGTFAGDWVVLDYWISKSFIVKAHNLVEYYVGGIAGTGTVDTFKVYYETSIPDTFQNIIVNVPSTGIFNVFNANPIFEFGYRTGYLFHGTPASGINSYWSPTKLQISLDKQTVCSSWNELLKLKLFVTSDNDLPLPYYPTSVTVSGASAILKFPDNMTDGKGEIHYVIRPNATGSSAIVIHVTCGTLVTSAVATIVASSSLIDLSKWSDGFVHTVVTNDRTGRGGFRTFTCITCADGLPRAGQVTLISKLASEFQEGSNKTLTKKIDLTSSVNIPNISGLIELGYVPQPNDNLFGYSGTAVSKIIKGEA